ncbi:MAG: hypothetical protein ACI4TH_03810, partial [Candidatus Ornithomonoglobus sp.]
SLTFDGAAVAKDIALGDDASVNSVSFGLQRAGGTDSWEYPCGLDSILVSQFIEGADPVEPTVAPSPTPTPVPTEKPTPTPTPTPTAKPISGTVSFTASQTCQTKRAWEYTYNSDDSEPFNRQDAGQAKSGPAYVSFELPELTADIEKARLTLYVKPESNGGGRTFNVFQITNTDFNPQSESDLESTFHWDSAAANNKNITLSEAIATMTLEKGTSLDFQAWTIDLTDEVKTAYSAGQTRINLALFTGDSSYYGYVSSKNNTAFPNKLDITVDTSAPTEKPTAAPTPSPTAPPTAAPTATVPPEKTAAPTETVPPVETTAPTPDVDTITVSTPALNEEGKVEITVTNNSGKDQPVKLIVASYDADGRLISVSLSEDAQAAANDSVTVNADAPNADAAVYKILLWDATGAMNSLMNVFDSLTETIAISEETPVSPETAEDEESDEPKNEVPVIEADTEDTVTATE